LELVGEGGRRYWRSWREVRRREDFREDFAAVDLLLVTIPVESLARSGAVRNPTINFETILSEHEKSAREQFRINLEKERLNSPL
jgi:hypothetical protein